MLIYFVIGLMAVALFVLGSIVSEMALKIARPVSGRSCGSLICVKKVFIIPAFDMPRIPSAKPVCPTSVRYAVPALEISASAVII